MARQYSFVRFAAGVDWKDVDPTLLVRLNRLGMALRQVITVVSGARGVVGHPNSGVQGSHHVPSNNPSGMGEAVDAYIGKRPLGAAVKEQTLAKYGLYSGNRPGFYQGKPDPEHIETLERRGQKFSGGAATSGSQPNIPTSSATPPDQTLLDTTISQPGGPPIPESTQPSILAPGTVGAEGFTPKVAAQWWQQLAAQPFASSETMSLAQRMQTASGG